MGRTTTVSVSSRMMRGTYSPNRDIQRHVIVAFSHCRHLGRQDPWQQSLNQVRLRERVEVGNGSVDWATASESSAGPGPCELCAKLSYMHASRFVIFIMVTRIPGGTALALGLCASSACTTTWECLKIAVACPISRRLGLGRVSKKATWMSSLLLSGNGGPNSGLSHTMWFHSSSSTSAESLPAGRQVFRTLGQLVGRVFLLSHECSSSGARSGSGIRATHR